MSLGTGDITSWNLISALYSMDLILRLMVSIRLSRMGSNIADKIPGAVEVEGSETNIEIKIKTLDSQTYTLRVDKQTPVPALKEQIASVTGVLSEQQRLICRGKVLKDDQLLSAYHVEDGHTLHLVVRQPILQSFEGLSSHSASDPASGSSHHTGQVAPSVIIETFSVPDQGDAVPPQISRIVSAVLGSFGFSNIRGVSEGVDAERGSQRTSAAGGTMDSSQLQSEQTGTRGQSDRSHTVFGLPTTVSLGSLNPPVIPDSLTTLSQYLSNLRREFDAIGRGGEPIAQADAAHMIEHLDSNSTSLSGTGEERVPTPASLAEVMLSSRQLLTEQVGECLLQLARQLENQACITDTAARHATQTNALRTGVQLHNLGALLLELGRTSMTLRLGESPSEAVVNAGPAVFINQSGPNPLMVQPLPFQPGTSFGAIPVGSIQPGSGLTNGVGTGFLPRRIDIQIRRGSSTATLNNNREEHSQTQQTAGQRSPPASSGGENPSNQTSSRLSEGSSFAGEAVRVVPLRTVVAAVPGTFGRLPSDSSGNSTGLYYPLLGRFQNVASGHGNSGRGISSISASSGGLKGDVLVHLTHEYTCVRSLPPNLRQEPSISRSISINILSASGAQNNQDSERHIPNNILQLLRTILPGDIHMEDASSQGRTNSSVPETAGQSTATAVAEPRATDEGIFLSNLLRQIMPLMSQSGGAEPSVIPPGEAQNSENQRPQDSSNHVENSGVGTSRRHSDTEPSPPNSKRQKTE
ncbi:LARGE PROLINE-RICH PROTEIN BAG6 [Salix purpurea]|uniref:LARGE PROLINE-RICH PROTEIN BAG6 n=1 Tax=Salix purpurea TaxID=77065 RepID=A0A9Q0UKH7_SALPP|nr:LARGE PROLINE-RICH PROTEIN BAG6 [Salix purpurea]